MPDAICSWEGCLKPVAKKGLCNGHYIRKRRGKPMDPPVGDRGGPVKQPRGTCSMDGCARTVYNIEHQLCRRHYHLEWKYGDPTTPSKIVHATWDEIRRMVTRNPETGCLEWTGAITDDGYGDVTFEGERWLAHRLFWSQIVGPLTDGLTLDHVCHSNDLSCTGSACRHRRCVDVRHLEEVPQSINSTRGTANRWSSHVPSCPIHGTVALKSVRNGSKPPRLRCTICAHERYLRRKTATE